MKTSVTNRNGHRKNVFASEKAKRTGKTALIARGECCEASKELQAIIQQTGLAPAEIAQHLKRVADPTEQALGDTLRKWLNTMPPVLGKIGEDRTPPQMQIHITLRYLDWIRIADLMHQGRGETIDEVCQHLIGKGIDSVYDLDSI